MEPWKTAPRMLVKEEVEEEVEEEVKEEVEEEEEKKKEKREEKKEEEKERKREEKERERKEIEEEEGDHGTAKMRLMNSIHCWILHYTYLNPHLSERKGRPHCRGLPSVSKRVKALRPPIQTTRQLHYPLAD